MTVLSILAYLLLGVGALGVLASSVFLMLAFVGAWKYKRYCARLEAQWAIEDITLRAAGKPEWNVPVSVLKPIHGADQYLREDLEHFFQQDHPDFELLFAARTRDDAGLKIVDELATKYPHVEVRIFAVGDPPFPNAKINSLLTLVREARHEVLVMSDSDVGVTQDYLRHLTRIFADSKVGLATCLYRGRHTRGLFSLLEALAMSVAMPAGVVTANLLEGMHFALGPTIVVRKQALDDIGGLLQFQDFSAEDYFLGEFVAAKGWRVELSHVIIDHNVPPDSARTHWDHQVRWARTTRYCRPHGHIGTGLIFAAPYGVLALIGGLLASLTGHITFVGHVTFAMLGWLLFGWACLKGWIQCMTIGWSLLHDPKALRYAWLYPLEDMMGFLAWMMSYLGNGKILWRGEQYQLMMGGRMVKCK